MLALVNSYAAQGAMLPRSEFELAEDIRDFTLAEADGEVAACGALHIYTPSAAEIRSLAVRPDIKGKGLGRAIVEAVEREARDYGLASLFAFTYVPEFFARLGFDRVDRGLLPQKAWKDCLRCPKFQACDEIAVHKQLLAVEPAEKAAARLVVLNSVVPPGVAGVP
jgi:amino-acid N-acetyltransferase